MKTNLQETWVPMKSLLLLTSFKKFWFISLLLSFFWWNVKAQVIDYARLNREVLFTFNHNEWIVGAEYFTNLQFKNSGFVMQTFTQKDKEGNGLYTFVFNGERVATSTLPIEVSYADPSQNNGYAIRYFDDNSNYVNIAGQKEGGFDDLFFINGTEAFFYTLAGKWYPYNLNKVTKNLTFPNGCITNNGKYAFRYNKDDQCYVNVNGTLMGKYSFAWNTTITESEKYAFGYRKDKEYYANINGKIKGAYSGVWDVTITESGKYAFGYNKNGKSFGNINGNIIGPYSDVLSISITESGKYAFGYNKNGQYYVNINGNILGPYSSIWYITITDNGKYAFRYRKNGEYYVNINNTIIKGPYSELKDLTVANDGKYSFTILKNGKSLIVDNQGEHRPTKIDQYIRWSTEPSNIELEEGKNSFYSDYQYSYVVIDGLKAGKSSAIDAWWNAEKESFVWHCVEGNELISYEYFPR